MKKINIKLGASFDFFYIGLIMIGIFLYAGFVINPWLFPLTFVAIVVLIGPKVAQFDALHRRYRIAYNLLGIKIGTWIPYSADDQICLVKSSDYRDTSSFNAAAIARYGSSGYVHSFKIFFATDHGEFELNVFQDYNKAVEYMENIAAMLHLKAVNDFENRMIDAQQNPPRR